ncbi:DnaB-like helicase C-terminal domain-containing protein [Staphylococcus aureus]
MIVIDYLQLIQGSGSRRPITNNEKFMKSIIHKSISRKFKSIIALSQLSRGVEQRQDKRPMMSDIRE